MELSKGNHLFQGIDFVPNVAGAWLMKWILLVILLGPHSAVEVIEFETEKLCSTGQAVVSVASDIRTYCFQVRD